jgi:hypothetical protein
VMCDPRRVMDAARRELDRVRDSAAWPELGFEAGVGADGHAYDRNAVLRAKVLWALQYDHGSDDLPLVRWIAEQEARCRHEAPFQGMSEETELAGFLLASLGRIEDVWLHWQIKRANFDTWCGYDMQYMLGAGVTATVDFVRASDHADRDAVLERLLDANGEPHVDDDELAGWWENARDRFPSDPAAEDALTWIERAKLAGEFDLARRELADWASERLRDRATLSVLSHGWAELGDFASAAQAQRESLAFAATPWDIASALQSLAALQRQAGDPDAAWQSLVECRRALNDVANWQSVGLGRMYVEELFLLAAVPFALAATVFAEADRQSRAVPGLPLVVLRAAVDAALHVGDHPSAQRYRELRDAEEHRIRPDGEP